ncbi:hypothetical protein OG741_00800 [Streptomyces sp. NBC_01410]|uniref:hypothetical protein n=1 Tax=Streptomyces sp. NBC_01410 TaxID=2903856 RepID=UPI00325689AC
MLIELSVRRLYCENASCGKVTFAEQVPGLTARYQRRTPLLQRVVEAAVTRHASCRPLSPRPGSSMTDRHDICREIGGLPVVWWALAGKLSSISGIVLGA